MRKHKCKANNTSSRSIVDRGDYEVIVIEEVEDWLLPYYEKYYIKNFPCVNKYLPFNTKEEYKQYHDESNRQYTMTHKEEKVERDKQYRQTHQTEIKQQKTRPYECECGHTIICCNKARHSRSQRHLQGIRDRGGISPPVSSGLVV
jgi:hypothetical protein